MDVFPGWASEDNGVYLIYCLSTKTIFIYRQNVAKILKQINHPESSTVQQQNYVKNKTFLKFKFRLL